MKDVIQELSLIGLVPVIKIDDAKDAAPLAHALEDGGLFILPHADRMPTRIGKSKWVPIFLILAGARFTVIRLVGNVMPLFLVAARTRSRASFTAASGKPTMSNAGRPPET